MKTYKPRSFKALVGSLFEASLSNNRITIDTNLLSEDDRDDAVSNCIRAGYDWNSIGENTINAVLTNGRTEINDAVRSIIIFVNSVIIGQNEAREEEKQRQARRSLFLLERERKAGEFLINHAKELARAKQRERYAKKKAAKLAIAAEKKRIQDECRKAYEDRMYRQIEMERMAKHRIDSLIDKNAKKYIAEIRKMARAATKELRI